MLQRILNKLTHLQKNYQRGKDLYQQLKSNTFDAQKPAVFFDIKDKRVESYYYPVLYFFEAAGYQLILKPSTAFLGSFERYASYLTDLHIYLSSKAPVPINTIYISDTQKVPLQGFKKYIYLSLNAFSEKKSDDAYLMFPFPMHPNAYGQNYVKDLPELRLQKRNRRIFFSGNLHKESYTHPVIKDFFKKENRYEILKTLEAQLTEEEQFCIHTIKDAQTVNQADYLPKFVWTNWAWSPGNPVNLEVRIENEQWLSTLAKSDFFLATPGIRMPLCHNAVEAMAVGTIPILEYAEHFHPKLEHLKNCIIFEGKEDLVSKVKEVLKMPTAQIQTLRKNVIAYYEQYHSPKGFIEEIKKNEKNSLTLYLYATGLSLEALKKK